MSLLIVAFFAGALTVLSPCILPVVPFVFARTDVSFVRSRLPLLLGLAASFALITGLGAAGLGGIAQFSRYGRTIALASFALFGCALLFPTVATRIAGPLTNAANGLIGRSQRLGPRYRVAAAALTGIATGLLWAPCAGPVLGLILSGTALHGLGWRTVAALAAYAAGGAASLLIVSGLGRRALHALRQRAGMSERLRRITGASVLLASGAIALGVDTQALAQLPSPPTNRIETRLVGLLDRPHADRTPAAQAAEAPLRLPDEGELPALDGATAWLDSPPLTRDALRGKVVVVNFWTYSCINCLRTLPYLKGWDARYRRDGLVVIGVHTPEFGFEREAGNVRRALNDLGIRYPVATDNDYRVWQAFDNQYWPAFYIADASGRIRYHHFGEGGYDEADRVIRQLLAGSGRTMPPAPGSGLAASAGGALAPADADDIGSGETYVGYRQAQGFASPEPVRPDRDARYSAPAQPALNTWGFGGTWRVGAEAAVAAAPGARIVYRFHARDLHLVLAPGADGRPVRIRVAIDGAPPGDAHGADIHADGSGIVNAARLYQLVRQRGPVRDHTFTIEFLDPGAQAFSFTFG
ncbi:cytochrome c biogenesis protein DipZ [Burkholderia sp. 22PA0106]|uniref:cytochrome c biogenesis protein DipZ n=1 Tax=Burkholderia sp. 22PA0106 TaxID=3237371 RepID=UPI0039C19D5F